MAQPLPDVREEMNSTGGEYSLPARTRLLRAGLRPVFRGIFHVLSDVTITGLDNVPAKGPYIIAMNHISLFEPPLLVAFWPVAPEAVGAVEIWKKRGQSTLAQLYGGIQVHRGEFDRRVVDRILAVLQSGKPLLIAPEGGRSHDLGMRRAMPGVAYFIEKADVPVVPVGVVGTTDDFLRKALRGKRPHLELRIGKPFKLPPMEGKGEIRRATRQRNADLIMQRIAELLPQEYHGVYTRHGDTS